MAERTWPGSPDWARLVRLALHERGLSGPEMAALVPATAYAAVTGLGLDLERRVTARPSAVREPGFGTPVWAARLAPGMATLLDATLGPPTEAYTEAGAEAVAAERQRHARLDAGLDVGRDVGMETAAREWRPEGTRVVQWNYTAPDGRHLVVQCRTTRAGSGGRSELRVLIERAEVVGVTGGPEEDTEGARLVRRVVGSLARVLWPDTTKTLPGGTQIGFVPRSRSTRWSDDPAAPEPVIL